MLAAKSICRRSVLSGSLYPSDVVIGLTVTVVESHCRLSLCQFQSFAYADDPRLLVVLLNPFVLRDMGVYVIALALAGPLGKPIQEAVYALCPVLTILIHNVIHPPHNS